MQLEEYLRELNKVKLLTPEEEKRLWESFKLRQDGTARRRIIEAYQPLVFKIAVPFKEMANIMDIIQEGTVGLIEAVEKFDYTRGVAFSLFAMYRIRGRMYNFLKAEGMADVACLDTEADSGLTRSDMLADTSMPVAEVAELHEISSHLKEAMVKLPLKEQIVLDYVYMQSQDVKEVASLLNMSSTHIYRLQKSGIRRVRGMLSKFMHSWK